MSNEQRIEQLERQCRWLFASLAGMVVIGGGAVFSGGAQNDAVKSLRVESLEIIDNAGKVRVRLGNLARGIDHPRAAEGMYGMQIKGEDGDIRAWLHDRAQLSLKMPGGNVSLSATGAGAIMQLDGPERQMAQMTAWENQALVRLLDNDGKETWKQATPLTAADRQKVVDPFR